MFEPPDTIEELASAIDQRFFAPLRRRADTLSSPAHEHLTRLECGEAIEEIADDYGSLSPEEVHHG